MKVVFIANHLLHVADVIEIITVFSVKQERHVDSHMKRKLILISLADVPSFPAVVYNYLFINEENKIFVGGSPTNKS